MADSELGVVFDHVRPIVVGNDGGFLHLAEGVGFLQSQYSAPQNLLSGVLSTLRG